MMRLVSWLATPRAQGAAIALGVLLALSSLTAGFSADDHFSRLILRRDPLIPRAPLDLFRFASGVPSENRAMSEKGVFPWWADPEMKLAFFRPLTAVTHYVDHLVWPDSAAAMHAHNLVWFALALAAAASFYRRFLGGVPAGLALMMYAIDDAHGPALGWIANRNAMVAMALALPVVVLHDRHRRGELRAAGVLAPLLFLVSLFSGEAALAAGGYLIAHAVFLDHDGPIVARLLRLWPYALAAVLWRFVYVRLGYGAFGSGVYLDPSSDTIAYLKALPSRMAFLLAGQMALPWSDFATLYRFVSVGLEHAVLAFSVAIVLVLGVAFAPLVRRDRTARFFAAGMVLSVLPIAATFPADRLLWFVGLGGFGLIAQQLLSADKSRALTIFLIGVHLVCAPLLLPIRSRSMLTVEAALARASDSLPSTADISGKTFVVADPPSDTLVGYILARRTSLGQPRPGKLRWLSSGTSGLALERVDAQTLRVTPTRGFFENLPERMLRSPRRPIPTGSTIDLGDVTITITRSIADGRPAEALFRFREAIDDPKFYWARWGGSGYEPFVVPAIGQRVTLPPIDFLKSVTTAAAKYSGD